MADHGGNVYMATVCPRCQGDKVVKCPVCGGDGEKKCRSCNGTGNAPSGGDCPKCHSLGHITCSDCKAPDFKVTCWVCKGTGKPQ